MSQLAGVRTNQDFGLHYEKGKLIPQTEVIILVEQPKYVVTKDKANIKRDSEIKEFRFKCGTAGLNDIIGQLQQAARVAEHYEQMAGSLNAIITNAKPPEGTPVPEEKK